MSPRSLSILAALTSSDIAALIEAADRLFARKEYAAAARAYAGLEVLEGRRFFTLRRALAESKAGDVGGALKSLERLLADDVAGSPTTVEALKLRASLDSSRARDDLELAARFQPATLAWS